MQRMPGAPMTGASVYQTGSQVMRRPVVPEHKISNKDVLSHSFPATLAGARQARNWLQRELRAARVPDNLISAFAVSLAELATNLVDHSPQCPECFEVEVRRQGHKIRLDLKAQAHSFAAPQDFRAHLRQDVHDVLSERGRGLMMVGRFFPDASYRPPARKDEPEQFVLEVSCPKGGDSVSSGPAFL